MLIKEIYDCFLNLIYKRNCLVCGCSKDNVFLCKSCAKAVQYLPVFAHRIYKGCPVYSACIYDGTVKTLICKLKFSFKKSAKYPLSGMLFNYFKKLDLDNDFVICYPDVFVFKKFKRGYNQVEIIVKEFSKLTGIVFEKNVILKTRYTKPQYSAKNRQKNIKGSFKINPRKINILKNKTVLLIDDITTTGATLNEIIDCFKDNNINNIICLTVATPKK